MGKECGCVWGRAENLTMEYGICDGEYYCEWIKGYIAELSSNI